MDWHVEELSEVALLAQADVNCRILITVYVVMPEALAEPDLYLEEPIDVRECYEHSVEQARAHKVNHSLFGLLGDGRAITIPRDHPSLHPDEANNPWTLSLGDLQLLGDALRRDPLAFPSALERTPRPPWPENVNLVDFVGAIRREEEPLPNRKHISPDGTEHLRIRAQVMAARHPAPAPDANGWCEVSRWHGSPDPAVFCLRGARNFQLLVRAPGLSLWVACADPAAGRYDLTGVICAMLAHWLARLSEHGWLRPTRAEILMCFRVEHSEHLGPALALDANGDQLRLITGPGFVYAMCRGDNSADRMLIEAVLAYCGPARSDLLDGIAPAGRGTFTLWPTPDVRTNPPRYQPPPLVTERDRRAVEEGLARSLLPEDQIAVISDENARPAIADLIDVLEQSITEFVEGLAGSCVLELVRLHEHAAAQLTAEEIGLPARDALAGGDELLGAREAVGERNVALRALIERMSAMSPSGTLEIGMRETGWLRAAMELEVRLGSAYDALGTGTTRARIALGSSVGLGIDLKGRMPNAGQRMMEQLEELAPDLMAREHHEWWSSTPREAQVLPLDVPIDLEYPIWSRMDEEFRHDYGVGFEAMVRLLRSLSDIAANQQDGVAIYSEEEIQDILYTITQIDRSSVVSAIRHLTLGPCQSYNVTSGPHCPWRPNRDRSYLRRPLVRLADGRLAWSCIHTLTCARHLHNLIEHGRLRGSYSLQKAVMRISQQADREFENALLARVQDLGWKTRARLKKLGGLRLQRCPGQDIGDIDILAWSPDTRQVWLLDAKRLAPAFEPRASARESLALASSNAHHYERLQWVKEHSEQLAVELGESDAGKWEVGAALVLDHPLMGAHIRRLPLPMWTFWELSSKLSLNDRQD